MDKGDALCAARLAQVEMIRAGTTCFADPGSYFSAETAQAVKESGMIAPSPLGRGSVITPPFEIPV